jgi:hypothetical protein
MSCFEFFRLLRGVPTHLVLFPRIPLIGCLHCAASLMLFIVSAVAMLLLLLLLLLLMMMM